MKAVILAGGLGTRLAPYTTILPKPLMPLRDKPILDVIIRQLLHHGVADVTLATGHMAELLMSYFGDGRHLGVRLAYSREGEPLGTAGPLSLIAGLTERFLVMNGDVLATLDFSDMLARHVASGAICTVAVHSRRIPIELGVVKYDARGRLTSYTEKPVHQFQAGMGIYLFEPRVLEFIPANQRFDMPELMKRLIAADEHVHCYPFGGYWQDIGSPDDYARAIADWDRIEPLLFLKS